MSEEVYREVITLGIERRERGFLRDEGVRLSPANYGRECQE